MRKRSVVLMGSPGSGKTVLITVMAMKYHHLPDSGVLLAPTNGETMTFVQTNWRMLHEGQWPSATTMGKPASLSWRLRVQGRWFARYAQVKVLDYSGEDFEKLFAADDPEAAVQAKPELQPLLMEVAGADVAVFIINLAKDVEGEPDHKRRAEREVALRNAVHWVRKRKHLAALALTQANSFAGSEEDTQFWVAAAREFLPFVYAEFLHDRQVPCFAVTAVRETNPVFRDGRWQHLPAAGFQSAGLDPLAFWIRDALHGRKHDLLKALSFAPVTAALGFLRRRFRKPPPANRPGAL